MPTRLVGAHGTWRACIAATMALALILTLEVSPAACSLTEGVSRHEMGSGRVFTLASSRPSMPPSPVAPSS